MGVLPNRLPGHAALADDDAQHRWSGCGAVTSRQARQGLSAQMLDEAGKRIKALYVMGANPATERPAWAANLDKLDFLVVQDLFLTETAQQADVVLPAVSWAEVDGTFTNLERRVQRAPKAVRNPHSKAAPDWMILDHLATRLGATGPMPTKRPSPPRSPRPCPLPGLTWDALGDQGVQWDAAASAQPATASSWSRRHCAANSGQRFALVSGTVLYDGGTLFRRRPQMQDMAFGDELGINPADAARMGIAEGDRWQCAAIRAS